MQSAESEDIEITWTKTCTLLLTTFLFTPALFAQTGGTLHVSNNSTDTTGVTTYIYTGQINTNINPGINPGAVAIGSGWHDVEFRFGTEGASQSTDNGAMNLFIPLNPTVTTSS